MKRRMYGMTNYQLTGIQKGIQFGHAVVEYGILYGDTREYREWAEKDKTFIVLDGGTTNMNPSRLGTLNQHADYAEKVLGIPIARFHEPDLGDQLTAFVFLVNERVWDRENYPDPEEDASDYERSEHVLRVFGDMSQYSQIALIRDWLKRFRLATN